MAHTIRKRWVYPTGERAPGADFARLTEAREATCKPGCETCGKGEIRRDRRKTRRNKRADINERRFDG